MSKICFSQIGEYIERRYSGKTVLAECILLGYYDEYINDNYVYSFYKDGKGTNEAFHQYMIGLVYGSNEITGKFIRDTVPAVDGYLRRQATQSTLHAVYSSAAVARTQIMDKIIAGYPVVASMGTNYGAKWNHTVVVYGLEGDLFRVHMGWHGTGYYSYYVNLSWFYECGFI